MSAALRPYSAPPADYEPDAAVSGMSPLEYLAILKRRRALILIVFFLVTAVGVLVTLLTPKVYESTAKLVVDPPAATVSTGDQNNPLAAILALAPSQSVETQAAMLQTLPMQQQVLQQMGVPVQFTVLSDKDTNLIEVSAAASDPNIAAQAANALLNNYISQSADQNVAGMAGTYEFVRQRKDTSHKNLLAAENALNDFQKRNKIVSLSQNQSDQIARVTALQTELQGEQSELLVAQARLEADRAALASQPPTLPVVTQGTNPAIIGLQNQIDGLQVQYQAITQPGTGFNPKAKNLAPQLRVLLAQIAELKKQKAAAPALLSTQNGIVNPVYQSLKSSTVDIPAQIKSVQAALAQTQKNLAEAQASVARFPDYALTLSRLTRDRDEALDADQKFGAQLSDLSLREKSRHASAHIIEPALPTSAPIRPNKPLNIAFAALIGLFLGICISLLQEFLDDRINTTEDADRLLGLPSLGKVPTLSAANARLLPQMAAADAASESYRVLRTNIHFSAIDAPLKTLLVTSSGPGEGKTTTAVNLAFAMVMDGKRVILVDTDLRRPAVHKMLGLPAQPGLTDVLLGAARLDDVLMQHSDLPGLMALPCGTLPPNPSEMLGSRAFRALLDELGGQADLLILDSPPALAAADAQILASQADGTVLVVETGETKKNAARQTLALLRHARANVLGIAYNKMTYLDGYYYHYAAPVLPDSTSHGTNGTGGGNGRKAFALSAGEAASRPAPVAGGDGLPMGAAPAPIEEE